MFLKGFCVFGGQMKSVVCFIFSLTKKWTTLPVNLAVHTFLIHSCIRESLAGSQWCLCDSVTPAPGATSVTPAPCLKHTSQSGDVFSHCVLDLYLPKCPFAQCIDSSCPWAVHFGHTELQLGWGKAAAIRNSLCVYLVPQVTSTSPCGLQALWTDDANV